MNQPPEGESPAPAPDPAPAPPEVMIDLRKARGTVRVLAMLERQTKVVERLNRGWSFREVAAELGLSLGQVNAAARASVAAAQRSFVEVAERHRARLLAKNHAAQAELWRAYERARDRGKVSQTTLKLPDGAPSGGKGGTVQITQSTAPEAEARLLVGILKAQHEEALIVGVIGTTVQKIESSQTKNVTNNIIVMNRAGLEGAVPWFETVPAGFARQGVGLLPPGAPEPQDAEMAGMEKGDQVGDVNNMVEGDE